MSIDESPSAGDFPAFRQQLQIITQKMARLISAEPLPQRWIWSYAFTATGHSGRTILVADPSARLTAIRNEVTGWPEFAALTEVVQSNEGLRRIILPSEEAGEASAEQRRGALDESVLNFVEDYLDEARHVPGLWGEEIFSRLYNAFASSISRNSWRVGLWAPLYRCGSPDLGMESALASGCALIEVDAITRDRLTGPPAPGRGVLVPRFFLRSETHQAYNTPWDTSAGRDLFAAQVFGIRLAVGGDARIREIKQMALPGDCRPAEAAGMATILTTPSDPIGGEVSTVKEESLSTIRLYAERFAWASREFGLAVRRFLSVAERLNPEDRLIDAVIGLESLLLAGVSDELSFQFALRGAWLLEPTDRALREVLFQILRNVYTVRSGVVHGEEKALQRVTADVLKNAIESLRRLLIIIITEQPNRGEWRKRLKSAVLGP